MDARPTTPTGSSATGAWVAELTGLLDLTGWPAGMRVIVRKERPHPGAQLRFTDVDGHRLTAFATNTTPAGSCADLELRHRRRARCEDRIRSAKDTGLRNLPLHDFAQNQIWCAIVALAAELTAWMQILALTGHAARRWEPKRLRLRLFSIAGASPAPAGPWPCTCPPAAPGATSPSKPSPGSARSPPQPPPPDPASPACPDDPAHRLGSGSRRPPDRHRRLPDACPTPAAESTTSRRAEPAEQPSRGKITQDRG